MINVKKSIQMNLRQSFYLEHRVHTQLAYALPRLLPHRYVFVLTNVCNLECSFCFQRKDARKDSMKTEDWLNLAKQLPRYACVTLTGGEPFAFKGFNEVFDVVGWRFDCNIITNGLLLNKERIEYLLSSPKLRTLSISVDNRGNTVRGVKPEDWTRTEGMMRYFRKRRDELGSDCVLEAKTVVLDDNSESLLDIHRYCIEDLECDHHSFQFLKGSPVQHADFMFKTEDILKKSHAPVYKKFETIKDQLEKIRQYNRENNAVCFLHPKVGSLIGRQPLPDVDYINNEEHVKENFKPCQFPWSSVHINVDGDLFPCMAIPMGNVRKQALPNIIFGDKFMEFKALIRKEGTVEACNRCGWLVPDKRKVGSNHV